ncbi:MAG: hypothetical protein P8N76_18965 [Pirellulaceae bacterium]|nr:hypothetical protein [Pirellulaceae bacterium]
MRCKLFRSWPLNGFLTVFCLGFVADAAEFVVWNADAGSKLTVPGESTERARLTKGVTRFGRAGMDGKLYLYRDYRGNLFHYFIQKQSKNQKLCQLAHRKSCLDRTAS